MTPEIALVKEGIDLLPRKINLVKEGLMRKIDWEKREIDWREGRMDTGTEDVNPGKRRIDPIRAKVSLIGDRPRLGSEAERGTGDA